ncbi:hypothetical protein [Streptomyces corynorhini]|uniref:Uncharacterized protein n=1 Tax=Streptomyces corynorhini TaxID=2282652 RepID=A0A370B277_9ACTN|nr:hypothetical protein [Streptomyces corynorhini]RDG33485.1 hypothetical protein DVH02_31220 [Streptomyces corynorhini]
MTEPTRYQTDPLELPLPASTEPDPAPVEGCPGCVELAKVRDRARGVGDMTTVTDCNVHMRRHPEGHR